MKELKVFETPSRLGTIYGAVGPEGLLAVVIPNRREKDFKKRLKKRAPGS